ncbi:hypothetical protein MSPP1_000824 [Malassezia sp. CBS 17886]|nr:hypothetical protein MSPP1_000824 [Malassezia sp. CBS 17886]
MADALSGLADRAVVRRAALVVGLGNYTHSGTRHSIGQVVLRGLIACAERADRELRGDVRRRCHVLQRRAERAAAAPPGLCALPASPPTEPFHMVRAARGWLARVSVLLDAAPPAGAAARRVPSFSLDAYPYVLMDLFLYQPRVLMNVSGPAVRAAAALLPDVRVPADILLLQDELARDFGKVSTKLGGSAGGHNGVRSVQAALLGGARGRKGDAHDIARIRVGIGRPDDGDVNAWVLGQMPDAWLGRCGAGRPVGGGKTAPAEGGGEARDCADAGAPILELVWKHTAAWCVQRQGP